MYLKYTKNIFAIISKKGRNRGTIKRMKYYCIKQHDITDCGAACLATICRQNGYKIGISKIREVAGTGAGLGYLATR